jgi:pyruvate,water dikinase
MEPGDVLVARFTVPTFNTVLAMAGAVVVEHGGLLCHAAVIARELGIPGVVGAAAATTAIPDGATVEVDPVTGTVSVVSST